MTTHPRAELTVWRAEDAGEAAQFAANKLAGTIEAATHSTVRIACSPEVRPFELVLGYELARSPLTICPGEFSIRVQSRTVLITGGDESALVHAVFCALSQLGAELSVDGDLRIPSLEGSFPWTLKDWTFKPAFKRRAFVSDIMTWHYEDPRLMSLHLAHDRKFIEWMAWLGINRFFYIRHARDTKARIDELVADLRQRGIEPEYGGHIVQLLLERERFEENQQLFPMDEAGERNPKGNLCVSNPQALEIVTANALAYLRDYPENRLLHVWGADVWRGAWCACPSCARLSPQLQYMRLINTIAEAVARHSDTLCVTYLAYHDTLEPDPQLAPLPNVEFEWAPRERCYAHAIDDPRCHTNARYYETLKHYVEIFSGRGHVFEYYADAALFAGIGLMMPSVIERDLIAYQRLGLSSISCLTFGAYSVLAYPANLLAFARGARSCRSGLQTILAETARQRHRAQVDEMRHAYALVVRASRLAPTYGDMLRVDKIPLSLRSQRGRALRLAAVHYDKAAKIASQVANSVDSEMVRAEGELWRYSARSLRALAAYLEALEQKNAAGKKRALEAIEELTRALNHIDAIDADIKGTWGSVDLPAFHQRWTAALKRHIEQSM